MIDGTSVKIGKYAEVFYQMPSEGMDIAEPAMVIRRYDQEGALFGICQGDQEIIVGGVETMKRLAKSLGKWAKEELERA